MKKELFKKLIYPELIIDPELREKVLEVWVEALTKGGWVLPDLERIPFTLLIKDTKISLLSHTVAVTQIALEAGKVMNKLLPGFINMDYLIAGALLHDVGKLLEYKFTEGKFQKSENGKYIRHPFSGSALAAKHGLPDAVVHIIAAHAKEGNLSQRSKEAFIVYHADFITFETIEQGI